MQNTPTTKWQNTALRKIISANSILYCLFLLQCILLSVRDYLHLSLLFSRIEELSDDKLRVDKTA